MSTIAAFYGLYSLIRDLHGANTDNVTIATHNAHRIIRFERHLHIFAEAGMQHSLIHARLLISGLDDFYGAAHFLAVAAVLIWLFLARPNHYRQWRNTLAMCTAAALIGFAPQRARRALAPRKKVVLVRGPRYLVQLLCVL